MLTALLVILFGVQTVAEIPSPRPTGWVTDQAAVIDPAVEARMNELGNELHAARGIELAIVTVDNVPGTPKAFATALFNHWRIGQAATNNGVLVLLVMGQRRLEIETGTGMANALTAAWLADMQARLMVPRFKQKDFGGGLLAGIEAMATHLKTAPGESATTSDPATYVNGSSAPGGAPAAPQPISSPPATITSADDDGPSDALKLAAGTGALGAVGGGLYWRRRRRTCQKCKLPMLKLSEIEDDKHLDAGQRAEELFRSANYEVRVCPGCQQSKIIRHGKWLSGFERCPKCSYRTLKTKTTTIREATYTSGGTIEVRGHCRHCNHVTTETRHTSPRSRPSTTSYSGGSSSSRSSYGSSSSSRSSSSSSSSSSSGYSGGSSSGGGAGSSW